MQKTILITGASSGIGKAAAKLFARNGWNVVATMRSPEAEKDLAGLDGALITRLDVQDRESIGHAIESGVARFGRIDALMNNAAFSLFGVFESLSPEKIREQFDVNVLGVMEVTRAMLPHFRQNKGGLVLNISSRAGLVGLPMISLYCATKFALEGFSESLAYELASQNIAVKIIEPSGGVTDTHFFERLAQESTQDSLPDYNEFTIRASAFFAGMQSATKTSAEEVARVILAAATDGTRRLRYFIGEDTGGFALAKRGMSEADYISFMRSRFLPRP